MICLGAAAILSITAAVALTLPDLWLLWIVPAWSTGVLLLGLALIRRALRR